MERLRSPSGLPTKVPYLFTNMLRRLMKEYRPDYLAVVFDVAGPTFRDKLFADYKAQRPPMPEDLAQQLPYVRRVCQAMRLPVLEYAGYEADDVIGALARQGAAKKLEVVIVTSDKDMLQLVGGGGPGEGPAGSAGKALGGTIRVLRPGSGGAKADVMVDPAKVEEILGVPPEKVADMMALMGDAVDNIPGAKGIGEKGAKELIQRFGSAEAALENAAKVEGKRYREALETQREMVLLSKQLATIATDVPVELDLVALARQEPDVEALRSLYAELGFSSLLKELAPAANASAAPADSAKLETAAALRKFLDGLPRGKETAVWLMLERGERPGDDASEGYGNRIAAVEISTGPGVALTVWLDEKGEMLAVLRPWLADAARPKVVHDAKLFELLAGPVAGIRHATQLYSYLLRPTTAKHDLGNVVVRQLNVTLAGAPGEHAETLARLAPQLRNEVEKQSLAQLYETIDLPLAPVLAAMERRGVRVDPQALAKLSAELEGEVRKREKRIWELARGEFNVNSPQQLAEVLFDKLGLEPPVRRGRSAKPRSTAADVLEEMALLHELPREVLDYREVAKLKSTYADALPRLIHPRTGRIHTSFSQTGTATGRLASSDPNLQNIPVRTELGREIRAAFAAAPGRTLLSADYSQIELRILAHYSGDQVLVEAFRTGEDIHSRTAQEVFGVGPMLQTAEHRRAAKVINFGIIYGLSAFGLAQQLGIEQKEAAAFIAAYFARYRGVKEYLDRSLAEVRQTGFTRTLFGRVRSIPEINAPQANMRSFAERTALNTPLQGTAADLIKLAMIEIERRLVEEKLESMMILQVHDELLFEAPPAELDRLRPLVVDAMSRAAELGGPPARPGRADRIGAGPDRIGAGPLAIKLAVPLVVDFKSGPNWRDMT